MSDNSHKDDGSLITWIFSERSLFDHDVVDQEGSGDSAQMEETTTFGEEWVANEPRNTPSRFVVCPEEAFTIVFVEADPPVVKEEWRVVLPAESERICFSYPEDRFTMHDVFFPEIGLQLPFTDLQVAVFNYLHLAPS